MGETADSRPAVRQGRSVCGRTLSALRYRAADVSCAALNTFDRYLLREWLKILGILLCATLGLLFMQALYDNFRDLLEMRASAGEVAYYFAVLMPSFFTLVLPIALLLSLLFVLGQLHRRNEFLALRSAGIGVVRMTRTIWLAGSLLCVVMAWLNSTVIPRSVESSRRLWETLQYRHQAKLGQTGSAGVSYDVAFDNQRERRVWFFNRYSDLQGRAYGVSVSELDSRRRERARLTAREASYDRTRKIWTFRDGREQTYDPQTGETLSSTPFTEIVREDFREDPQLMLVFDRRPIDLSFFELQRIMDYFAYEDNPKFARYAVRYYGLLADTFVPLIIIAIAIPFAMTGVRVSPAVGVSKSLGLFVLYVLLARLGTQLGSKEIIHPLLAAWLPNLGMAAIAAWFVRTMR